MLLSILPCTNSSRVYFRIWKI